MTTQGLAASFNRSRVEGLRMFGNATGSHRTRRSASSGADQTVTASSRFKPIVTPHRLLFYGSILALCAIWIEVVVRASVTRSGGILTLPGIPELIALFTVYALTEVFQARFSSEVLEEIKSQIQFAVTDINKTINDSLDFTYIGAPADALEYAARQMQYTKRVKETYLRSSQDDFLMNYPRQATALYQSYAQMIEKGGFVELIMSKHNAQYPIQVAAAAIM